MTQPRFLRQILGAFAGVAIALVLYGVYTIAYPPLQAWLFPDSLTTRSERYTLESREEVQNLIVSSARKLLEKEQDQAE